jgi:hypothetical protein
MQEVRTSLFSTIWDITIEEHVNVLNTLVRCNREARHCPGRSGTLARHEMSILAR